jgi:hypothetical protein
MYANAGNTKGGHCTIDLLFDRFGIRCMTTDNFCFYLQNRLIQTSQTGGQQYSDTSLFNFPWLMYLAMLQPFTLVRRDKTRVQMPTKIFPHLKVKS